MIHWSGVWGEVVFLQIKASGLSLPWTPYQIQWVPYTQTSSCKLSKMQMYIRSQQGARTCAINIRHERNCSSPSVSSSLVAQSVKNLPAMRETWVRLLDWEDTLEKGTATHSSILAWRIPWTEELGRLQSLGSQRVRHDWATLTSFTSLRWVS